ncbi:MAG: CopD family protein [Gammaproteobacteria bacterium]|nr:CopD family protein [Gammaproteobacteria bacterium]MCP5458783.1 CopD family protein [Gammaproteobacteria bacterium]
MTPLLLKALHLIFMVTWFAALFYLPRLYVYHAMSEDEISKERFKIMERKLFYGIMMPGGVLTLVFGIWMLVDFAWALYGRMGWLHVKLTLIALMIGYHIWCGKLMLDFKHDRNRHSHVWYRWFNEVPVIFLVGIIMLSVLRPF